MTSTPVSPQMTSEIQHNARHHLGSHGVEMAREAMMAFLDSDVDGDHMLDFEEFRDAVPQALVEESNEEQVRSNDEELRQMFAAADADGSGLISLHEYMMWTLSVAHEHTGAGLEAIFRRYDENGEGNLDIHEFKHVCEDTGFDDMSENIFKELDLDASGRRWARHGHASSAYASRLAPLPPPPPLPLPLPPPPPPPPPLPLPLPLPLSVLDAIILPTLRRL